jgi:hypothetical protein
LGADLSLHPPCAHGGGGDFDTQGECGSRSSCSPGGVGAATDIEVILFMRVERKCKIVPFYSLKDFLEGYLFLTKISYICTSKANLSKKLNIFNILNIVIMLSIL